MGWNIFRAPPPPPPPPPPALAALIAEWHSYISDLVHKSPAGAAAFAVCLLPLLILLVLYLLECLSFKPLQPPAKRSKALGNNRFSASKVPESIDAVVIGSGQGGLSCASVLAQYGQRVVVLEQHEVTGGGAHCFAVDGKAKWRFDAGHHITIPWHEQVLHLACGTSVTPVPFDKTSDRTVDGFSDRIVLGEAPAGEEPVPIRDDAQLTAELIRRFPQHKANILRYMSLAESVQMRFGILTAAAILPMRWRRRLLASWPMGLWRKWAGVTASDGLREIFPGDDEDTCKLRSYLSGLWLDAGSPPSRGSFFMQTAVMGGWQKLGVSYPRGGPQNTALAMVEAIEQRGGAVFVRAPVASLVVDPDTGGAVGVMMSSGHEIRAKTVVSALGYRATEALVASAAPSASAAPTNASPATALPPAPKVTLQTPQSAGFVMANVALRGSSESLGISSANLWIQPSNRANGYDALDGEKAYFADPLGVDLALIPVGITFPSAKEEPITSASRSGHTRGANGDKASGEGGEAEEAYHTCQILALADYAWFKQHTPADPQALAAAGSRHAPPHVARLGQPDYDALKKRWSDRLLELLYRSYPGTKGKVAFADISTPLTLETYLRADRGAGVGLDVTPERFVSGAELSELDMRHPRVPNLWRCGQDYLMCGQVLSAASGIICALRMLGPLSAMRFALRAARLLLFFGRAPDDGASAPGKSKAA